LRQQRRTRGAHADSVHQIAPADFPTHSQVAVVCVQLDLSTFNSPSVFVRLHYQYKVVNFLSDLAKHTSRIEATLNAEVM
jgi:hypothetical protein